jgi:hypothetical protein
MRGPWHGAQFRAKIAAPLLICSGSNVPWAATLAP